MQGHTRYVNITLGIGGYQPFPAKTVFETGYGDCKALSNYMHALLAYAGIKSYPALVSSGRYIEPIFKDFPNFSEFDHVIVCVPLKKDTLWLECTSQSIPFGFLGDFTDDRDVLLITDQGGKFAHTKCYSADDNMRTCKADFTIDPFGIATCSVRTNYHGLQYNDIEEFLNDTPDDQKKWLYKNSDLPSLTITKFDFTNDKKPYPTATINESNTSKTYGSITGNYMVIPLNRINVEEAIPKVVGERQSDFIIKRSSLDYDTLVYHIPANYKIESVPDSKNINSPYGEYSFTVTVKGNELTCIRRFKIKQGTHKAADYKSFYNYCLAISKADDSKAMLVQTFK